MRGGQRLRSSRLAAWMARVTRAFPLVAILVVLGRSAAAAAPAPVLVALAQDGSLLLFAADRPETPRRLDPTGVGGRLVGIDARPADGKLYGLSTTSDLYRLD